MGAFRRHYFECWKVLIDIGEIFSSELDIVLIGKYIPGNTISPP